MAKVKRLTKPTQAPRPEMPMDARNWDDPKTQHARIVTRAQQPIRIAKGPSGFVKRGR